jgi:spore coat-associated protein N
VKKIIGLTIAALLVMGLVGGGTWAYFSDVETSTGNTLTAGTLDLNVDGGNSAVTTFTAAGLKPGDNNNSSNAVTLLTNNGSLPGKLSISAGNITHSAGSIPGDTDIAPTDSLYTTATMAIYIDVDSSGAWSDGDIGLESDNTTYTYTDTTDITTSPYQATINSYASASWSNVIDPMATTAQVQFGVDYIVPSGATNAIQGGSVSIDFTFTLDQ